MKLVFTRLARGDLARLRAFIAHHNPDAAARAAMRIKVAARLLVDHPVAGRPIRTPAGDLRKDIRELPLSFGSRGYVLRYQISPHAVRVLRIWHTREDRV